MSEQDQRSTHAGDPVLASESLRLSPSSGDSARTQRRATNKTKHSSDISSSGAIVRGLLMALVFYLVVPRLPGTSDFVQRYFCSHPLEYVGTCLFFVGLGILWSKLRKLSLERLAVERLQDLNEPFPNQDAITPVRFERWLTTVEKQLAGTIAVRRVSDAMQYVQFRQDNGLEEHLKYLADLATDRLHQSYALMRTISWAIPILGFLGTVIGITMAIANVTPEQLDSSLPEVTGGLAVAFDTTAQALGMSIVLVFGAFLVERGEQSVLNNVEQFGIDSLVNQLGRTTTSGSMASSIDEDFTKRMQKLLLQYEQSWGEHLNALHAGWNETLAARTAQLSASLDRETQATLDLHRKTMLDSRDTYAVALQQSSDRFAMVIQQTMGQFVDNVGAWQNALQTTSLSACGQAEELHRLGRTLLELTEAEHRLAALQQQLNQNLQALEVVATLEQTVSSLNAAVHVLTAKTSIRAAA